MCPGDRPLAGTAVHPPSEARGSALLPACTPAHPPVSAGKAWQRGAGACGAAPVGLDPRPCETRGGSGHTHGRLPHFRAHVQLGRGPPLTPSVNNVWSQRDAIRHLLLLPHPMAPGAGVAALGEPLPSAPGARPTAGAGDSTDPCGLTPGVGRVTSVMHSGPRPLRSGDPSWFPPGSRSHLPLPRSVQGHPPNTL